MPAPGPVHPQQVPEHATGLLDLPGHLLCLIRKQLGVEDRKSVCCPASMQGWVPACMHLPLSEASCPPACYLLACSLLTKCPWLQALLTRCEVELQPDGSPTSGTQLQHWPRYAPPPQSLLIATDGEDPPTGRQHPFVSFLISCMISCMQQPSEERLLSGVTKLQLEVRGHLGVWAYFLVCLPAAVQQSYR